MRVPEWAHEAWDRLVASDPGLTRLRMAFAGVLSMVSALAVEYAFTRLLGITGQGLVLFLLMGGIIAMIGSMALSGLAPRPWVKVRTAVFFPVAFGVGITVGILAGGTTATTLGVFVAMTFLAVYIRRFGMPFFFYGFMGWLGYMFSTLLGATFAMLPGLLLALTVGAAWVLLLSLTVLGINPARTLRQTLVAFRARLRTIAAICADLADVDVNDRREFARWQGRLHRHQRRLTETALMIEATSGEQQALPDAEAGQRLRNQALDAQLAIDALADSVEEIALRDPDRAGEAAAVVALVIRHDHVAAHRAADRLQRAVREASPRESGKWWPAYRLVEAVGEFAALAESIEEFRVGRRPGRRGRGPVESPAREEAAGTFRPAVEMKMGSLPSSFALADQMAAGGPLRGLGRLSLTTRQAIQAALAGGLAILAGHALSEHRYYWALLAVFVTFSGTSTRAESVRKAIYRLLGTLTGLVVAMLLAHVTAGDTTLVIAVIAGSLFCGFYLIRISYAFMIFFITIMVAQLYNVLGEYSNELLLLRLEETAIGVGVGMAVALLFLPLSTRDTVYTARDNLLTTLGESLTAVADRLEDAAARPPGETTPAAADQPALEELSRKLDEDVRQLAAVTTPFSRPAMWGNNGRHLRYRLTRFAALSRNVRSITITLRRSTPSREPALAEVCRTLAETAHAFTREGSSESRAALTSGDRIAERLDARLPDDPPPGHYTVTRALLQINGLLAEIGPTLPGVDRGRARREG